MTRIKFEIYRRDNLQMQTKLCVLTLACLTFVLADCKSSDSTAPPSEVSTINNATPATPAATSGNMNATAPAATPELKTKLDVCSLIDSADLKTVQGEGPTASQRSDREDAGFIVAQCYYSLPTTTNSVVLNVTTRGDGAGARDPRDYWQTTFAAKSENEEAEQKRQGKSKDEGEEAEAAARPQKIGGLGEDAYWIANRVGGALYVLKKDLFFRISVGGAGDANAKLKRSKALALKVLKRI